MKIYNEVVRQQIQRNVNQLHFKNTHPFPKSLAFKFTWEIAKSAAKCVHIHAR